MAAKRFQDDKRYLVEGKTLNELFEAIQTATLLKGPGYDLSVVPGSGTRLKIRPGEDTDLLWDLQIVNPATAAVKITNPGLLRRTSALDNSGLVSIVSLDAEFNASAGNLLYLEATTAGVVTLKMGNTWPGWPMPIDTEETDPPGAWVLKKYYYPLHEFVSSPTDPAARKIQANLYAERRAIDSHLRFRGTRQEDKDGHVVPAFEFVAAPACRR